MSSLKQISDIEFPNTPTDIAKQDNVRVPVVKASAYTTFALEEAGIDHSRDLTASMATDATHNLKENKTPTEYLELAVQELAHAESEVDDNQYQDELRDIREKLQNFI